MANISRSLKIGTAGLLLAASAGSSAFAGSHTWRINEVFSNASGTVQFIELIETCGTSGETFLSGHQVLANANAVNLNNLAPNSSANKTILLGTANLPMFGGPTPDYVIPANFISLTGVSVQYTPYQNCNIGSGTIPTNGTSSLNRGAAGCATGTCPATVALNSPRNFNGDTSPVNAATCTDGDGDGYGNPGDASCPNGAQTDCNDGNPAINPGATEDCDDTVDNDCDGNADCLDSGCLADPNCAVPTVSQWGVISMTLLVLTAGTILIPHRILRGKRG